MKDVELQATPGAGPEAQFLRWWTEQGSKLRVAVYGRGRDFDLLRKAVPSLDKDIMAVIDDSGAAGCVSLPYALEMKPDAIIAASLAHQEAMRRRLRKEGYAGQVVLLYANDPELGALAHLAYDSSKDWPAPPPPDLARPRKNLHGRKIKSVLLFAPPFAKANSRHKKTMPLGLLYIAAAIRRSFPEIKLQLYDAHIARHSWEEAKRHVDSLDFDLLLCSFWSVQSGPACLMSSHVMATKDSIVLHGGVHPTLLPQDSAGYCDAVIPGEGELKVVEAIRSMEGGPAGGPLWSADGFIEDLDALPFPAWDLLSDPKSYDHPMHVVGGWRFPILGSRGCPFSCSFCSSPLLWKRRVRWRSPANVVSEMDSAHKRFGVERFHFWDDNFLLNQDYAKGLCEELFKRGSKYLWCGLSRASDIVRAKALLPILKDAGCVGIEIGVESFNDQVSKAVGKGEFAAVTAEAAEAIAAAGMAPLYTHMLFVPGETASSYRDKELFMSRLASGLTNSLRSDSSLGQLATPHVCTGFAAEAPDIGLVLWKSPADSFHHRVNFIPNSLLDDILARKEGAAIPDPLPWLSKILQSVYDWTEDDMRSFIRLAPVLWDDIDGRSSLRTLIERLSESSGAPFAKTAAFAALAVVDWGRAGLVVSSEGGRS